MCLWCSDGNQGEKKDASIKNRCADQRSLSGDRRFSTLPIPSSRELAPIYSNRSASFLKLSKVSQALADAEKCVELRPDWDKAYFRKATALEASDEDDLALIEFEAALAVATESQEGMIEQKIRLCKQRLLRTKREEHHQPSKKQSHGAANNNIPEGGKVREKGTAFRFVGAAVAAQIKMKTSVAEAAAATKTETPKTTETPPVMKVEDSAKAMQADAEKKAAEKAAAAKTAATAKAASGHAEKAAEKTAAETAANTRAVLVKTQNTKAASARNAEAAAALNGKRSPKKSPRPSKKPEPTPTWLPAAVLGGIGAILLVLCVVGGGKSKRRA